MASTACDFCWALVMVSIVPVLRINSLPTATCIASPDPSICPAFISPARNFFMTPPKSSPKPDLLKSLCTSIIPVAMDFLTSSERFVEMNEVADRAFLMSSEVPPALTAILLNAVLNCSVMALEASGPMLLNTFSIAEAWFSAALRDMPACSPCSPMAFWNSRLIWPRALRTTSSLSPLTRNLLSSCELNRLKSLSARSVFAFISRTTDDIAMAYLYGLIRFLRVSKPFTVFLVIKITCFIP